MAETTQYTSPYSLGSLWALWNGGTQAFESVVKRLLTLPGFPPPGVTFTPSKEWSEIKSIVQEVAEKNLELAARLAEYQTKLTAGTLTPLE